jgi:hypothetical protein
MPKDLALPSICGDCIGLISEMFPRKVQQRDGTYVQPPSDDDDVSQFVPATAAEAANGIPGAKWYINKWGYSQDDEDEGATDEVTILAKMIAFKDKILAIYHKHRVRAGMVAIATMVGIVLYILQHKRHWLWGEFKYRILSLFERRRLLLEEMVELEEIELLEGCTFESVLEGKGKTKRGRGHMKSDANKKKSYIIYDDTNIELMLRDGAIVNAADYKGKQLPKGHYVIAERDADGILHKRTLEVTGEDDDEPDSTHTAPYKRIRDQGHPDDEVPLRRRDRGSKSIYESVKINIKPQSAQIIEYTKDFDEYMDNIRQFAPDYAKFDADLALFKQEFDMQIKALYNVSMANSGLDVTLYEKVAKQQLEDQLGKLIAQVTLIPSFAEVTKREEIKVEIQKLEAELAELKAKKDVKVPVVKESGDLPRVRLPDKVTPPKPAAPSKKETQPVHEALIPQSPVFQHDHAIQFIGEVLDKDQKFIQHCVATTNGILMNNHSREVAKFFKFADRAYACPFYPEDDPTVGRRGQLRVLEKRSVGDLLLVSRVNIDGLPIGAAKKYFDNPSIGQDVSIITYGRKTSFGKVIDLVSGVNQMVSHTCSTEPGWCGLPVINSNGKFVALHSQAGVKNHSNLSIAFTGEMINKIFAPLSKNE